MNSGMLSRHPALVAKRCGINLLSEDPCPPRSLSFILKNKRYPPALSRHHMPHMPHHAEEKRPMS